jgi:hypothetical protein
MEPLYEIFSHGPLRETALWGMIAIIAIGGVLIFKLKMRQPKKEKSKW